MARTLITNGLVVSPSGSSPMDVLIDGETIAALYAPGQVEAQGVTADRTLDATGKYVIPGGIDVHTHMELPFGGTNASDTFETGTRAAAWGGVTTIVARHLVNHPLYVILAAVEPVNLAGDGFAGTGNARLGRLDGNRARGNVAVMPRIIAARGNHIASEDQPSAQNGEHRIGGAPLHSSTDPQKANLSARADKNLIIAK